MSDKNLGSPYSALGRRLRVLRTDAKETLSDVAGAVEIEVRQLAAFEIGQSCPTQDVMLLLVSHFNVADEEAVKLWELAGYHLEKKPTEQSTDDHKTHTDKIMFTDVVDVMVNNYGVVMNFMQSGGHKGAPQPVARVGMSREHAKSVLKILQITLAQTERNSTPQKENYNK